MEEQTNTSVIYFDTNYAKFLCQKVQNYNLHIIEKHHALINVQVRRLSSCELNDMLQEVITFLCSDDGV